mmetsp:Transcript_32551/g.70909  ORF Transcript_32551/g.70909 Transcript_32551/m.70909 type:complete len:88 (-) Transcript_32551:631-894(-)
MSQNQTSDSLTVKCRIRPVDEEQDISTIDKNNIKIQDLQNPRPSRNVENFNFDKIFDKSRSQNEVFEDIGQNLCENAIKGFKNCVVA